LICDTLENSRSCLSSGIYAIRITKCKLKALVFNNTVMPQFCGQIKVGNGVYSRHDGSIIVGALAAPGCIVSPRSAFDLFYERFRKNIERGKCVSLEIKN
ncbi:MAG: hypothetical protein U0L19_10180, partial [Bacteroidales bacterium]|nr:hypothetical protein [Bacteroidales bacterium]